MRALRHSAWLALLLVACGGTMRPTAMPLPAGIESAGDASIAVLRRATGDAVLLSMFIDAGARDGEAGVATLAAWAAAQQRLASRVYPDATQVSTVCTKAELARCADALVAALSARSIDDETFGRSLVALREARRRAMSDRREAEALALASLLGDEAAKLEPLGREGEPARATVERFLAAHYGPSRALFVATGEIEADELRDAVEGALERGLDAREARAERTLAVVGEPGLAAGVGDSNQLAIAVFAPTIEDAARAAASASSALAGVGPFAIHAFEARGGALAIASCTRLGVSMRSAVSDVGYELARIGSEPLEAMPPSEREDPAGDAVALGLRWAAGSASTNETTVGLGVVVAGGREGTSAEAQRVRAALERELNEARDRARGDTRGVVTDEAASVVTANGARLEIARREGPRVGIVVRYEGGAALDVPSAHGETALLATLATTSCGGLDAAALGARMHAIGASMTPFVDASAFGLVVEAPREAADEAIAIAADCASRPAIDSPSLEAARLRASERASRARDVASTAEALAPEHPGVLAPNGTERGLARATLASVRDAVATRFVGARLAIGVVGEIDVGRAVRAIARRVQRLEAGTAPARAEHAIGEGVISGSTTAIALHAETADASPLAARAIALEVAREMGAFREVTHAEGLAVVAGGRATAYVVLEMTPEATDQLPVMTTRAIESTRARLDAIVRDASLEDALGGARSTVAAMRLAERRHGRRAGDPARTARALLAARPIFVLPARRGAE